MIVIKIAMIKKIMKIVIILLIILFLIKKNNDNDNCYNKQVNMLKKIIIM